MSAPTLRLILGDQLNPLHSWFAAPSDDVIHVLIEMRQETDYVLHHAQKILAIFAAMRAFARQLREAGHRVHYVAIDNPSNRQTLPANLDALIAAHGAGAFEYQQPDEWRLDAQLADYARGLEIPARMVDSEHFYTTRSEAAELFEGRKQWLMEHFYRAMRRRHRVLMDGDKPVGGQWNFDHDNRKPWPGTRPSPATRAPPRPQRPVAEHRGGRRGASATRRPTRCRGPQPRRGAGPARRLRHRGLPHFGDYQDAMSTRGWRLFHSLLSFALNTKMLTRARWWPAPRPPGAPARCRWPRRRLHPPDPRLARIRARRLLGPHARLRRGQRPRPRPPAARLVLDRQDQDALPRRVHRPVAGARLRPPHPAPDGDRQLRAARRPDPAEVHRWYLGIYIDAFEWVELPNTVGMSQFADGGLLATKPYVSSAAYLDRMGDYCKGCHYDKARSGSHACPFNALYWDFFDRQRERLGNNHRLGMVYRQLDKMEGSTLDALRTQAAGLRERLDSL
jgi:deoxyribodipyrimidine photolyase-related protein